MVPDRAAARRRNLLKMLMLAPLAATAARSPAALAGNERSLAFRHTHTDERLEVVYFAQGRYLPDPLARIDRLLRDFRTGETRPIDRELIDLLFALRAACGGGTFEIISGYRSPQTNRMLRRSSSGVAAQSLHLEGRAIDVRLAGFATARLRDAAIALGRGGVGHYPDSDFLHIDTGRVRAWGPRTA
jgi:uncharacterized protein YcbK (DUF882 family)